MSQLLRKRISISFIQWLRLWMTPSSRSENIKLVMINYFFFHLEQHIIFGIFCSRKFRTLFFHASFLACINSLIFFYIFYKNSLASCSLIFWGTLFICITFYLSWMKKQRKTFLKFLH